MYIGCAGVRVVSLQMHIGCAGVRVHRVYKCILAVQE